MPWFVICYLGLILVVALAGLVDDLRAARGPWRTSLSFGCGLVCVGFVLQHYGYCTLPTVRLWVVAAVCEIGYEFDCEWREFRTDPDYEPRTVLFAMVMSVILFGPALWLGWTAVG